jgi:hypothetical protein
MLITPIAINATSTTSSSFITDPQFLGLVLSGLIALLASFAVQWIQNWRRSNSLKRRTAAMLEYEIFSIKTIASESIAKWKKQLSIYEKSLEKFKAVAPGHGSNSVLITRRIGDMAFPRGVYDRPSMDLTLFDDELAVTISELYRRAEFSSRLKQRANDTVDRFRSLSDAAGRVPDEARGQAIMRANQIVAATKDYFASLEELLPMCVLSLKKLGEIRRFDEKIALKSFEIIADEDETSN